MFPDDGPNQRHADPAATRSSRRALLAGLLGGAGALIANALGRAVPAEAAAGSPLIMGSATNSAGTSNTTLTTDTTGTALLVKQNGTGTALRGSAAGPGSIAGFFTAPNGTGISGVTGNGTSYGVFGQNNGPAGAAGAIRADGKSNHGVVATTADAVHYAVYGKSTSTDPGAVGIVGESSSGTGISGSSTSGFGVSGFSNAGKGLYGESSSGVGVWGAANAPYGGNNIGVLGTSGNGEPPYGVGVKGASAGTGVLGEAGFGGTGVHGSAETGTGVLAQSGSGAPLRITAGAAPTGGARQLGELYVNAADKTLYFHDGSSWRKVALV